MKADLKRFYQKNGFIVFGGAYSHYPLTNRSIPHLLNFSASPYETTPQGDPLYGGTEPYKLLHNQYFELLSSQGYTINVLANSLHFDYCSESALVIDNCVEYAPSGMKRLKGSDLVLVDKLRVVFSHFLSLGYTFQGIRYAYDHFKGALSEMGIDLPPWNWGTRPLLMPLTSLEILDTLSKEIATLPRGNIVYSHLMIPHQPYVLRSDCSLNPSPDQWKNNGDPTLEQKNTLSSREERYRLYFHQMKCVYRKLENIFDQMRKSGVYEDSIIILHGDHGSRISRFEVRPKYLERLSKSDLEDEFSTLFAVKLPELKEHYSSRRQPIEDLLAKTIFPNMEIRSKTKELEPFFFMRGQGRKPINFP
ncbi:MAG: sulfatase-like hydrolase/transferase [Nitrospirae bacterium]|nr:sulfatase-like hydrolase/transferase [Nitrospirota bacterium]